MMGTEISVHPSSTVVALTNSIGFGLNLYGNGTNGLPVTSPPSSIKFRAYPVTGNGVNQVGDDFFPFHEGSQNNQFLLGIGSTSRTPEVISATRDLTFPSGIPTEILTVQFRLCRRFDWAGMSPLFGQYDAETDTVSGLLGKPDSDFESYYLNSVGFNIYYRNAEGLHEGLVGSSAAGGIYTVTYLGAGVFELQVAMPGNGTETGSQLACYAHQWAIGVKPSPLAFFVSFDNV